MKKNNLFERKPLSQTILGKIAQDASKFKKEKTFSTEEKAKINKIFYCLEGQFNSK